MRSIRLYMNSSLNTKEANRTFLLSYIYTYEIATLRITNDMLISSSTKLPVIYRLVQQSAFREKSFYFILFVYDL